MKIYTSRYGNKEIARTSLVPVGISIGNPRFKLAFKVEQRIKELAPCPSEEHAEHAIRYIQGRILPTPELPGYNRAQETSQRHISRQRPRPALLRKPRQGR